MKYIDLTLATPVENLACDETLLDWCEAGECEDEILRFWEPRDYFVVVGYANRVATEVNLAACEAAGVPVLRRCSGGGAVLQGPGCLNYALILRISPDGPLRSIGAANRFILERHRAVIESEVRSPKSEVRISVCAHTDLAVAAGHSSNATLRKFSGNSQRRRRHFLLYHGTFLLSLDLSQVERFLPLPSKQPDYRRNRSHADFLTNLDMPANAVKAALRCVWDATDLLENPPLESVAGLVSLKYSKPEWNSKF
jgi:lipoate-protein ligase A